MTWRSCRLGDALTLKRGHDLPDRVRKEGSVPVVSSSGITGYHAESKAQPPGVVTGRYGTLGEVFFIEEEYWPLNTALYVIDFKGNDPRFCSYFLRHILNGYRSDKAAVPGVDRNVLHEIKVRVPDVSQQVRIALYLKYYDDLIANNKRRIELLEQSARLLYREWFVRLKYPGHEHDRSIGGVPEGWTLGRIADFYDTASGGTPSRKRPEFFSGDIPWVKTQELNGQFILDTEESINAEAVRNSAAKVFPQGTLIVAMYGATIGELGLLAIPAATNQACCAILPREGGPSTNFAYWHFREEKNRLVALGQGAAQNNVSQAVIRDFRIVSPAKAILGQFEQTVTPLLDQILNLQKQVMRAQKARDLLLPRLMDGRIFV